jgi:hypothetical protein
MEFSPKEKVVLRLAFLKELNITDQDLVVAMSHSAQDPQMMAFQELVDIARKRHADDAWTLIQIHNKNCLSLESFSLTQ